MAGPVYQVRVEGTDIQFSCGEDEFVLAAMGKNRQGPIRHGCYGGGCGVCKMRLVQGQVACVKKMSRAHVSREEERVGMVLLCCVKPRSDLLLAWV